MISVLKKQAAEFGGMHSSYISLPTGRKIKPKANVVAALSTKPITIYDIAKTLDISAATVSRALKNDRSVNKQTIKKVMQVAEEMNYIPNYYARYLKLQDKEHKQAVNIYDIAKYLGISAATVSRCLDHNCAGKQATIREVQNAAIKLGYKLDGYASKLRTMNKNIKITK